jgi:hypothetical protein
VTLSFLEELMIQVVLAVAVVKVVVVVVRQEY